MLRRKSMSCRSSALCRSFCSARFWLDGDSGNAARVIDQLNFVKFPGFELPVIHAKGPSSLPRETGSGSTRRRAVQLPQQRSLNFTHFGSERMSATEDRLSKVSGCGRTIDH